MQALLWSALVFPGAGHFLLKQHRRGFILAALSLLTLTVLMLQFALHASRVLEPALLDLAAVDWLGLTQQILQACAADSAMLLELGLLGACWIFGMLDAYRMGQRAPG